MNSDLIGKWAFIGGMVVAVLAIFIESIDPKIILLILFILGLLVGLLNVNKKNNTEFLVAVIALIAVGSLSLSTLHIGELTKAAMMLEQILGNFISFVSATALAVSTKVIITTTKK